VTDEKSFANIRNWIRNIEQHASESVNKILVGNKCDLVDQKVIDEEAGKRNIVDSSVISYPSSLCLS
jgi:Ras-related protein Rab-8A